MRKYEPNKSYDLIQKDKNQTNLFSFDENGMQYRKADFEMPEVNWRELFEKLIYLLRKPFVSLKYRIYKKTGGLIPKFRVPWFKVVILGLFAFIVLKKDMQFQVNLKAPLGASLDDRSANESNVAYDESSLAHPASWLESVNPFAPATPESLKEKETKAYIKKFEKVAKTEMEKYGIPASIKMAQALIESRAGKSTLAKKNNNHFGMKCFSKQCKKGHCSNFNDDHHKDFFRKFDGPWESWRLHSKLLQGKRYIGLKKYGKDYKKWAEGLKKAGYATDKRYDKKLISIIKKYQLYRLDS